MPNFLPIRTHCISRSHIPVKRRSFLQLEPIRTFPLDTTSSIFLFTIRVRSGSLAVMDSMRESKLESGLEALPPFRSEVHFENFLGHSKITTVFLGSVESRNVFNLDCFRRPSATDQIYHLRESLPPDQRYLLSHEVRDIGPTN
jgi:hypothetical protein